MILDDIAIIALVPGLVEVAKRLGLPTRYAGLAAILSAIALVALSELGSGASPVAGAARSTVLGLVYGLAASGLYSQVQRLPRGPIQNPEG